MILNWIFCSLAPFGGLGIAAAPQQPAPPHKLTRIPATEAEKPDARADDWTKRLSAPDLDQREAAFSELVQRARGEPALRSTIEQWAHATGSPDLAWTARLALRELQQPAPARPLVPGGAMDDLRQRFDALEQHFGGMDSTFDDLRAQMEGLLRGLPQTPGAPQGLQPGTAPKASQQSQSYSLQVGPDGVKLETTEDVNGNSEKRTYEAKDMQELLRNNPELRDKIGAGGSFDLQGAPGQNWFFLDNGVPQADWLRNPRAGQPPPTDVLGIYSQKLTPEQARSAGLEPEQGLRVLSTVPGTIAQILGLHRGDTLVELNGEPIYGTDDVHRILAQRKPEADVVVTLIEAGAKQRRTLRWSPAAPPAAPAAPAAPPAADKPRKL